MKNKALNIAVQIGGHIGSYQLGKTLGSVIGRNNAYVGVGGAVGSIIAKNMTKSTNLKTGFEFLTTFSAGIASGKPKADAGLAGDGDTIKNRLKSQFKEAGYKTRIKITPKYLAKIGLSSLAGVGSLNDHDFTSFEEIPPLSAAERQQFDDLLSQGEISGFSELDTRQIGTTDSMNGGNSLRTMKL